MNDKIKLVILGGSAIATPKLFEAMAKLDAKSSYDVVLVSRSQNKLDVVQKLSKTIIANSPGLNVHVSTSTNVEEALIGADFILNQIRIGGLEGRVYDETFPRKFGILGEESVGPGSFTSSMRNIPPVLEYCHLIEKIAPQAVFLNLTNPSSIIQYAIRKYSKVNVIGICDMPVTLMQSVADVLEEPIENLQFDWMGMNHFGWLVGVRNHTKELLPEVLDRLEKFSNLEINLEVIRALGLIPANYLKFYFHPDRYLSLKEGQLVRGQELIEIYDKMQHEMEGWKPGDPLTMLDQRNAAWYEKIIVPVFLALSEKRTVELVMSVENDGMIQWLPQKAIVELPALVKDGIIQKPRISQVPLDVQGLITRNCAYEMFTAEAIVEKDRNKAIRALLSNLLVSNFQQVEGILKEIWVE